MKCYNWISCLIGVTFILSVAPSNSKTHTYTWAKGNIEITANGVLEQPGTNDAQNSILVKEATRTAGYRSVERFLSALPLDSTRNIGILGKSNTEFARQLNQWIIMNSLITNFKFTSDSTGSVKISVDAQQFAKFISRYDKPVIVKTKTAPVKTAKSLASDTSKMGKNFALDTSKPPKTLAVDTAKREKHIAVDTSKTIKSLAVDTTKPENNLAMDTSKMGKSVSVNTSRTVEPVAFDTSSVAMKKPVPVGVPNTQESPILSASSTNMNSPIIQPNPLREGFRPGFRPDNGRMIQPGSRRLIQADVQMDVAKDTSIPENIRISQAEAGIRGKEKQELYRQIADTPVSGNMTYTQWIHAHPEYEDSSNAAIENNTMMGKPQWNADSTQVKLNGRIELRFLLMAVRQAEMKIQNANTPVSKDTTKVMPSPPPPPAVKN